jgi:predicted lipoprotein with Yx(FWY)xxD motif
MRTSRSATIMLILVVGAAVGACSSGSGKAAGAYGAPVAAAISVATAAPAAATPAPAAAGTAAVSVGDTSLGKVLVDGKGMTLYIFTPDGGGKSVCNGDCAKKWPPLAGGAAPSLGAGLDAADFVSITRDDGSSQMTFYGLPLYHFAGDAAAGDVNGQGLSGKWYAVKADGKPVK